MALGSTQPLTEMSTSSISWGQRRPVHKADNLTTILGHRHVIWEPNFLEPSGYLGPVMGLIWYCGCICSYNTDNFK